MSLNNLVLRSAILEIVESKIQVPEDLDRIAQEALNFVAEANANYGNPDYFGHVIRYRDVDSVFHANDRPREVMSRLAASIGIVNQRRRT